MTLPPRTPASPPPAGSGRPGAAGDLAGKSVLVLGLGESGLAMARWCALHGARLTVADTRAAPPNADALRAIVPTARLAAGPLVANSLVADSLIADLLAGVDLVAISPGVPLADPLPQAALAAGLPVVSEIELFAEGVRRYSPGAQILAITGSNGKTTTTALTAALCNAAGRFAVAAGNISPAALDALMDALDAGRLPQTWVLELSSFQLETTHSLAAAGAVVLNVSEDHLDRYAGMDAYAAAKARVYAGDGLMVINRDDARVQAMRCAGRRTTSFGLDAPPAAHDYGLADGWLMRGERRLLRADALQLAGTHNVANALAALALCESVGIAPEAVVDALASFRGLPHRVEFVARVASVDYYDDSKGTNVGATLAALQGMGRKVAIILGGDGKGQDFSPLKDALAAHARGAALIGRDAQAIATAVAGSGVPLAFCADMDAAVGHCAAIARPGDAVLLSPACASLDMYRNYAHRAEVFIAAVERLPGQEG